MSAAIALTPEALAIGFGAEIRFVHAALPSKPRIILRDVYKPAYAGASCICSQVARVAVSIASRLRPV
jgi:hypothetical protein